LQSLGFRRVHNPLKVDKNGQKWTTVPRYLGTG